MTMLLLAGATMISATNLVAEAEGGGKLKIIVEELQPVKREEESNLLEYEYILDILKTCKKHAVLAGAAQKKELISRRRKALRKNDMNEYSDLVGEIEDNERSTLALLLIEVLEKLEIPIPDFQKSEAHHS